MLIITNSSKYWGLVFKAKNFEYFLIFLFYLGLNSFPRQIIRWNNIYFFTLLVLSESLLNISLPICVVVATIQWDYSLYLCENIKLSKHSFICSRAYQQKIKASAKWNNINNLPVVVDTVEVVFTPINKMNVNSQQLLLFNSQPNSAVWEYGCVVPDSMKS